MEIRLKEISRKFCDYYSCDRRKVCRSKKISRKNYKIYGSDCFGMYDMDMDGNFLTNNWECPYYKSFKERINELYNLNL